MKLRGISPPGSGLKKWCRIGGSQWQVMTAVKAVTITIPHTHEAFASKIKIVTMILTDKKHVPYALKNQ